MDHVKPNPPPERPAVHPHICESGKWRPQNSTKALHLPPLSLSFSPW